VAEVSETPLEASRALPGTLGGLRPPAVNIALLALTAVSAFVAGALLGDTQLPTPSTREAISHGLAFSAALIAILLTHEMGHFVFARKHGVDATWPYFIPAPILSLIGTLGAVIKLRSLPRTRRALIDIGAAGPIAGFLVTLPILYLGLRLSTPVPLETIPARWTLFDAAVALLRDGEVLHLRNDFDLGQPLAMLVLQKLAGDPPAGMTLALHPVAIAGWFGLLLTALNLLPLGQLDGGHCLYAVSPRLHRLLGTPLAAFLFILGLVTPFTGWALWGLVIGLFLSHHPPLQEPEDTLPTSRKWVAVTTLALFVCCFVPVPVALLRA
jgi:membrane-associated protease RseP (regulator of RpoE activity)